jgi:hypothetical protein
MTDERIKELMGWPGNMSFTAGDMAYRIRALVVTAEREEREACAAACVTSGSVNWAWRDAEEGCANRIRERSNLKSASPMTHNNLLSIAPHLN